MKNLLLVLCAIIILILTFYLYKCCNGDRPSPEHTTKCNHVPVDMSQVVFWRKPGVSKDDFQKDINSWFHYGAANQVRYCDNCDSDLVVVSGADVVAFLSGQTSNGSPPKNGGGPSGDDGFAYFSMDFPMEFKDSIKIDSTGLDSFKTDRGTKGDANTRLYGNAGINNPVVNINQSASETSDTVIVAVFDTGVDTDFVSSQLYKNDIPSCLNGNSGNGWNFPEHTDKWQDDYEKRHGTVVSKLIVDQEYQSPNTYIKILPVKVHTKDGVSHLSDILCALQYAKNRGAQIINASFGFYAPRIMTNSDTASAGALLFSNFLKNYFANNNILMIAAAGNMDDTNENHVYFTPDLQARRNLDSVSFYPASFASSIPNVFAVTTVSEVANMVSPRQNFSENVVDIGVNADAVSEDNFVFEHPYMPTFPVQGSSFATPIVTGKMAAHYQIIKALLPVPMHSSDKDKVLDKLMSAGLLHIANSDVFKDKIRKKRMMNK